MIMPHRDPETGQFVGHDDGGMMTSYTDFEHQQIQLDVTIQPNGDTNPSGQHIRSYEPLEEFGGLEVNEVAELVHVELTADMEIEDETGTQTEDSTAEMRGVLGGNLPADLDAFVPTAPLDDGSEKFSRQKTGSAGFDIESATDSDPSKFMIFQAKGSLNDYTFDGRVYNRHFRRIFGRGPVLRYDDGIDVAISANAGNTVVDFGGNVRAHLVWDVAETDEAGREFSVPEG